MSDIKAKQENSTHTGTGAAFESLGKQIIFLAEWIQFWSIFRTLAACKTNEKAVPGDFHRNEH